ncbi:unnamed protein product [Diamesa serratosioi]
MFGSVSVQICKLYPQIALNPGLNIEMNHPAVEQHFVPLEQLVNSLNKKINTEKFIETFKTKLFDKISTQFEISWSTLGIGDGLTLLEYSKSQSEKIGDNPKWRPSGKAVDEQVRPILINALQRKKHFFEKQQRFQAEKLKVIIQAVEESRRYIHDLKERQFKTLQKIDKDQLNITATQIELDICRNNLMHNHN